MSDRPTDSPDHEDVPEDARARVEAAEGADDDARLELLEKLHEELEAEIDDANPPGR